MKAIKSCWWPNKSVQSWHESHKIIETMVLNFIYFNGLKFVNVYVIFHLHLFYHAVVRYGAYHPFRHLLSKLRSKSYFALSRADHYCPWDFVVTSILPFWLHLSTMNLMCLLKENLVDQISRLHFNRYKILLTKSL